MSTQTKEKSVKKVLTDEEKIANTIKALTSQIRNQIDKEGKIPTKTFGNKVGDGIEKAWSKGKIPSEDDIKSDGIGLGTAKQPFSSGALTAKAINLMTRAYYLKQIEDQRTLLKKQNKDSTPEQIENKLRPFVDELNKKIKSASDSTASTS